MKNIRHVKVQPFHCASCDAVIPHPLSTEDCPTVRGVCAHLVAAGAVECWQRVYIGVPGPGREKHILTRGGWLCRGCAERYVPKPGRPERGERPARARK